MKRILLLATVTLLCGVALAETVWTWTAGRDLPVEGVGYVDGETPFVRWPARAKGKLPSGLWSMGRQSTGVYLRFKTDADRLAVRWTVENEHPTDPLIPEAGLSGLDVYRQENSGRWRFVGNKRYWSRDHGTNVAGRTEFAWVPGAAGIIYLPTRSHVVDLRVGVPRGKSFAAFPHPAGHEKPVVHYGTSIVHGGCASRPGLTFTAIAGRALDRNYINLGFSGAAKMEIELPPFLAEIDAAVYVIDPVWNMNVQLIEERAAPFLRKLKELRPTTPILLCEGCTQSATPMRANVAMRKVYDMLKAEDPAKWANLHYFSADGMFPPDDDELTHDFCHPNDWGSKFMGPAYAKRIQEVLSSPLASKP